MTKEEAIKRIGDIKRNYKRMIEIMTDNEAEALDMAIKALEPKTIQEIQAESEKYQKAFEDGYGQGYAQARFDYEQEPCEDVISREAVLNEFYDLENLYNRIKQLPSVNPQPNTEHPQKSCDTCEYSDEIDGNNCYECVKGMRNNYNPQKIEHWIPVTERLPEIGDYVLVYDGVDMFVAWYSRKNMWQGWDSHDSNFERDTPIIAWMPLPDPYVPQESKVTK